LNQSERQVSTVAYVCTTALSYLRSLRRFRGADPLAGLLHEEPDRGSGADGGVRDIKVTSPGEAPQERKKVAHGASRGRIAKSTKPRQGRKNVLPPPPGAAPVARESHGLRRGLLSCALTG
jgi:hypothetical protein